MVFVLTHTHSLSLVKIDLECNDPQVFMYDSMYEHVILIYYTH